MKKVLLSLLLVGVASGAFAQGSVYLDNINNSNPSTTASSGGLFFLNNGTTTVPINQDFNVAFYGGPDAGNLVLIHSFSGASAAGGSFGPGLFLDPTGNSYVVIGATPVFKIEAWTGPATSYAAWLSAGQAGTFGGTSFGGTFSNPTAVSPTPPPDLTGMSAVVLSSVPEPGTFALAGLGAAAMLIFRRRK